MRQVVLTIVLLAGVLALAPVQGQQEYRAARAMGLPDAGLTAPDPRPLRFEMSGGLTAYVIPDRLVPLVRFSALIGAGSADAAGAAQFAAGLRAGPAAMAELELERTLQRLAATFQVVQTHTETSLTLEVPREDAEAALGLFAALLREPLAGTGAGANPASASASATGESGPVLYEGSLETAVRLLEHELFAGHPYGGAYPPDSPLTADQFRDRYVAADNVVLAVSGDFDATTMRQRLARVFAGWGGESPLLPSHPLPEAPVNRGLVTYALDKLQGWVAIGHELPPVPLQDEAPLLVMNYVLGGGHFDTRLFRATRDRRGLTNDDSGFPELGFRGPGLYTFRTYGRPEAVRLLIHLTLAEIERMRAEPVTEEELFVAQGALADGDFSLWFRNGAATASTYAREWLRHRDHARTASWQRAVTAEQVLDAARRYLHPERMQIVVVGPIDAIRTAPALEGEPRLETYR